MVVAFKIIMLFLTVVYAICSMSEKTQNKVFYLTAAATMATAFIVAQILL